MSPVADDLSMSSFVILGLLSVCGPRTPYELKKLVDGSIGYFWDFPRAQLYVEPERLRSRGLLAEERESEGRRRRTYRITEAGLAALGEWLGAAQTREVELRDAGLLKLYFGALMTTEEVIALARREAETHRRRRQTYIAIARVLEQQPEEAFSLATLRLGLRYEEMEIRFWEETAADPPRVPPPHV
ncbi:MAG TPA: helix-turn-helix transcriptional regulator [Ktedonobacterales bacterium]|nr:helix-turn-helix transcriptional regulator [Ktedonobacterales bacterium]